MMPTPQRKRAAATARSVTDNESTASVAVEATPLCRRAGDAAAERRGCNRLNRFVLATLRAIAAVALLSLRAAIRSRVVLVLLLLLAAGVVGLPRLVAGDGTPASDLHIRLRYTLAFGTAVLGLATLWSACAAFAAEIDSRRIELTAVKPVHPLTLWLGRWVGLLVLNALLLAAVVAGVRWQLTGHGNSAAGAQRGAALLCRTVARPVLPSPEIEARRMLASLQQAGRLQPGFSPAAALRQLTLEVRNRYAVIQPGERVSWTFRLDQPVAASGRLWLRLRFDTAKESMTDVRGVCRLRRPGDPAWSAEVSLNDSILNELELPVSAPRLAGAHVLELEFEDQCPPQAAALLIQPRQAVAVLTPAGPFALNLVRVWLAHLALLAALAALGLTLGACFSFPVAAFIASALLIVVLASTGEVTADEDTPEGADATSTMMTRISKVIVNSVARITLPVLEPEPLAQAAAGERVPTAELVRLVAWGGLGYPLALALLAAGVLRKRELVR